MEYQGYSIHELSNIIHEKIISELYGALKNGTVSSLLNKYGIILEKKTNSFVPPDILRRKILVIGHTSVNIRHLRGVANEFNVKDSNIEFVCTDEDISRFSAYKLKNYADIIMGAIPHKMRDMGDTNSLKSLILSNPESYPKTYFCCEADGKLARINKNDFKLAIEQSNFVRTLKEYN